MNRTTHFALLVAGLWALLSSYSFGHGGGVNQYGCHRQSSTNTYHCHSGPLDGQTFATEQALIDAYNIATGAPPAQPSVAYNRDEYLTSWLDADGNCRSTRHEVLAIESRIAPTFSQDGCTVIAGLWYDPFTGQQFTDPSDLDIDHMVPLEEAHISGGQQWPSDRKRGYANDLLNAKSLIAVSASANRSKGSRDPAQWLPPNTAFHCDYVKDWTEVKRRHSLEMDVAEKAAIESVLGAGIEYAARLESGGWNENVGRASSAVFGLGMRRVDQCAYAREVGSTENIEITISVLPEASHINQAFSIYLIAELPNELFSLNDLGQFVPFTGQISSLAPFQKDVLMKQSHEITAFKGILNEALTFNLYVGYQTAAGDFVYTLSPLRLSIVK